MRARVLLLGLLLLAGCTAPVDTAVRITFWTWLPKMDQAARMFEASHPGIKVKVVNAGMTAEAYTKIQIAHRAGRGAPDLAQIEYSALPQFVVTKQVADLSALGAGSLAGRFTDSAWAQVTVGGRAYGIPQDTGPMVMFYRRDVFERHGLTPPRTWAEFTEAGRLLRKADPEVYLSYLDPGDPGTVDGLLWQAGAFPFQPQGETGVRVDLTGSPQARAVSGTWSTLLREDLVRPVASWTDEWWKDLAAGRYAVWFAGAWAPSNLASSIPGSSGRWGVAPMPRHDGAAEGEAENGGSSVAVLEQSPNKAAALTFARWLNAEPEGARFLNGVLGLYPATRELMADPAFLDAELPFFAGQRANQVFAAASAKVRPGWHYLPYQPYANTQFKDTVGPVIAARGELGPGLARWQNRITGYGRDQGFTITTGG
ncbi:multiple sugar transport system substrate-binding protein [Crossiella equi]|uniref:Multiple sugar transport system substrate-binding protein n=1 Tax=Crossiella equi TaxID=130796 RepID=A0ABS5AP84_9PSEU|nr:sugar ABC transporter substrate-binding protein [Crossiella equi]MBP2478384.1 multiple sugar transport system substrate-binding protein [Crossiella equi]